VSLLFLSFLLLASLLFGARSFAAGARVYTLGVVPQLTPLDTHRRWMPFVQRLQKMTGLRIELKVYQSIPQFEADFLKGVPDFVFLNPYHEVMAKRAQGYIPLVRDSSKPLVGILVVRKDSPIHSVRELNLKEIAFPAPNALGASLYMRALLAEQEKITIIPRYVQTHSNVFRYVVLGFAAAGGAVNKTLSKEPPEIRSRLRVLYRTPGLAPHPLSAHPRVAQKVRQAVRQAVLEMAQDEPGRRILAAVQLRKPIAADYQRDYAPLDKLKLDKYVVTAP
jgi:phosphonate transport system substrate-binding protein